MFFRCSIHESFFFFLFLVVAGGITLDLMTSPSEKNKIKVSQFLGIFFTLKN
jgi:hypothetical protein